MRKTMLLVGLLVGAVCTTVNAAESAKPSFEQYLQGVRQQALDEGVSAALLDKAMPTITFQKRSVKADKNQPEKKLTLDSYLPRAVPDWKISQGRALYKKHKALLDEIAKAYQVQPRFIVALWGIETNYGKFTGNYSVLSALATLAYDGRREALFRSELLAALKILDQGHIPLAKFKGSWAGAMGQTQFMPSSFLAYAQDYDKDGHKDIWTNQADIFASIANYLKQSGWDNERTWGRQVKITRPIAEDATGLTLKAPLSQWHKKGVTRYNGHVLPKVAIEASLVMPDGPKGRLYLAYDNYHVLMKWNRSTYFVSAVGFLSDRIKYPPIN